MMTIEEYTRIMNGDSPEDVLVKIIVQGMKEDGVPVELHSSPFGTCHGVSRRNPYLYTSFHIARGNEIVVNIAFKRWRWLPAVLTNPLTGTDHYPIWWAKWQHRYHGFTLYLEDPNSLPELERALRNPQGYGKSRGPGRPGVYVVGGA